ncbi:transporter [Streptacidiphilus fuscans]|uniref:Transporter n=1 Tax=Streptacidiphilus fuscans TaxID=2789292 RepID=A0A931BCL5_9ACTN|nr:transporter [Streptacidiphilus fuscans]MBF9071738.1 transporter [Streptacidiphilus fuscans]
MDGLRVFRFGEGGAERVPGLALRRERDLQRAVEMSMAVLLGADFVASEYATGEVHRGRIDSLGLDRATGAPVLVEYKRGRDQNVVNQALFYLSWLEDHRSEFEALVERRLGLGAAAGVDWSSPRVVCLAADFSRFDREAVRYVGRRVELVRFHRFEEGLLALEDVVVAGQGRSVEPPVDLPEPAAGAVRRPAAGRSFADKLGRAPVSLLTLFWELDELLRGWSGVERESLLHYVAYRRQGRNFACVTVLPGIHTLAVYLTLPDPVSVGEADGLVRDVRGVGHLGTGTVEARLTCGEDLESVTGLLHRAYAG